MKQPAISAIICTHNPRSDYIGRALEALHAQTLSTTEWELLLVDNASDSRVSEEIDLSWHPKARHLLEERLGLTYARVCGITHAASDLLVFVDDDNLLDPKYLEVTLDIARNWPMLGAWGGQWFPEFECFADEEAQASWTRTFAHDLWSNLPICSSATPRGAGMCVRREVAELYVTRLESNPIGQMLGRKGLELYCGEDIDLALSSCEIGLGTGSFTALKLTHLVPAHRLGDAYRLAEAEGMSYSDILFRYQRGEKPFRASRSRRLLQWYERLRLTKRERRFERAKRRGRESALKAIERIDRAKAIQSLNTIATQK